ncbi:MAG: hypothetical protein IJD52_01235 [Alphaproteobacteria bacterium]|nr:hypothetical protein [Alphaproteobacteria bacterium]
MSFLKNTISLLAVFSVIPAAFAATARPSVMANASVRRMPTMTAYINGVTGGSSSSTTTTPLLSDMECIDAYTSCMKTAETCGENFEECTTKVLFHGKMPQCLTTLAQCSSSGINSLFGTSNTASLANVATQNSYGEVTDYTYPTDGSVLGQMITGAAISNKYDTATCVKRYSSCLRKESVCGADFELCTTNSEFKKQRIACESTLAKCQSDGLVELFGTASTSASVSPTATSRVGEMIAEGASLAAVNAVSTCYKVVDNCILGACAANPYRCYENATESLAATVDAINDGTAVAEGADAISTISSSAIASYIKGSCLDTIGGNKYCYATFLGEGKMPTSSQLLDEDNKDEVYSEAYSSRMNSGMKSKIADLVNKFDTKAKEKCVSTIKSCAMRVCGSGSGAACYSQVFGATDKSINNDYTREEIKTGCAAIVNTDANCKYAAQNPSATGAFAYTYNQADAFDILFPEYDGGAESDPIGVVASLNAALATNYSDAAIAQMKKQCQSVATSCVRSLCGADFQNCYRNRTDIYSSLTNSGDTAFDKSMNKVGGVLDYTIVLGLCMDTVKNANVCEEHLAIERNKLAMQNKSEQSSWGASNNVRSGWIDAGSTSQMAATTDQVQAVDENGNNLCSSKTGDQGPCYTVDSTGAVFDTPVMIAYTTYVESQAASTLFKDLIYDLEIEAQAKYNAKLTKQQNLCLSSNDGGLVGKNDLGSTFMWVKLKSNKVPANYSVAGLTPKQFVASNELYGSFCRVRVTLQSEDKAIQDAIFNGADWSVGYFAAGDAFTCGSWIPSDKLEEMANAAGDKAAADKEASQPKIRGWMTALGAVGGGVGGAFLGAGIQDGSVLGGLTGKKKAKTTSFADLKKQCTEYTNVAITQLNAYEANQAHTYATGAVKRLESMGVKGVTAWPADVATTTTTATKKGNNWRCGSGSTDLAEGTKCLGDFAYDTKKGEVLSVLNAIKAKCEIATESSETEEKKKGLSKGAAAGIGAAVTAVAGGALAYTVTDSIMDSAVDKAKRDAIQDFMDNVGSKIHCYIGGEEVATYGEVVSTSME